MVAVMGESIGHVQLSEVVGKERELDADLYRMAEILA